MLKFSLSFDCDNDAFAEDPKEETARILREVADQIASRDDGKCRDINGNNVGEWEFIHWGTV